MNNQEPPVIVFDGHCELCNGFVDFVLKWEKKPALQFTANQNEPGKALLAQFEFKGEQGSTVYLVENGNLFTESTAALRISRYLRFPWNLAYGFVIVPPFIRNAIYRWVAKNRYRWFGKKDTCRIPSPEERARFLL